READGDLCTAEGFPNQHSDPQGAVPNRARVPRERPASLLPSMSFVWLLRVPDLARSCAPPHRVGGGPSRDGTHGVRGLRWAGGGAAQDGNAREWCVACHGDERGAYRGLPHLGAVLTAWLEVMVPMREGVLVGQGGPVPPEDLGQHSSRRDLGGARRQR